MSSTQARPNTARERASRSRGVTRREALAVLAAGLGGALLARPATLLAEPQASKETTEALDEAQDQLEKTQRQLDQLGQDMERLSREQEQTLSQISETTAQIASDERAIAKEQAALERRQDQLAARVVADYKQGHGGMMELLLSSTSFEELNTRYYYVRKANDSDRELIAQVKDAKARLEEHKRQLEASRDELEQLHARQSADLEGMRQAQATTQQLLDKLGTNVKDLLAKRDAEILQAARDAAAAAAAARSGAIPNLPSAGGGEDYQKANARQRAVVDAAHVVPSPGLGLCAAWVSQVYAGAGLGYPGGNACDMYANYTSSSNKDDLKVGMIVAVSTHSHTSAGRIYGHVGIYVGDGKLMDNVGSIRTIDVDEWISYYGTTVTPRWGWAGDALA